MFNQINTFSGIATDHGAPPNLQLIWIAILVRTDMFIEVTCLANTTCDGAENKNKCKY